MREDYFIIDTWGAKLLAKGMIHQAVKDIQGRVESTDYFDFDRVKRIKEETMAWVKWRKGTFNIWCYLLDQTPRRIQNLIWEKCKL